MADNNEKKLEESHAYEKKKTKQNATSCRQKQIKETKSNLQETGTVQGVVGNLMSINHQRPRR